MDPVSVTAISYVHGDQRVVAQDGDRTVHWESDLPIWRLAAEACRGTLSEASRQSPDLLLYVSENETEPTEALARLIDLIDLQDIDCFTLAGHNCGNLGFALRVAGNALATRQHDRVLLVLADRCLDKPRMMDSGLAVFSDGAASCLLTRAEDTTPTQHRHVLSTVSSRTGARPGDVGMLAKVQLAADALSQLARETGRPADSYDHVLFSNYRIGSQKFLTSALKMPHEKLLTGPVEEFGHCFSADVLITLDICARDGRLKPGNRVLASSIGPFSWSLMDFTFAPS